MNRSSRSLAAISLIAIPALGITLQGCVSRAQYDQDVGRLAVALHNEKADKASNIAYLEGKVHERGKTLSELTSRYIAVQKENEQAQTKLNGLKGDLEKLLHDVEELKLVLFTNVKGQEANEMMIKLIDMRHRLKLLLEKEKELGKQNGS